ncbi:MAG: DoxX family protein [Planctomycetaceae bacterium]
MNKAKIVGWVLSGLLGLMLIGMSASGKFTEWEGKDEMFQHLGVSSELIQKIGILEVVITVMFLIPRTAFLGAILLTGYLGGAVVIHLRVGDAFVFPILLGIVVWIALGLRQPGVFALAFGGSTKDADPSGPASLT